MPRVHNVASLLKRWLLGTLQGGVQQQHLDYYLDEVTFRFNRRRSNARGLLFHRLAQQAVAVGPTPYSSIVFGRRVIPSLDDHDRYAHSRIPMDMILQGISISLFHAKQQWSRMSS